MSVEHMAMVFAADGGLDGPEKLLLLAYTNYTDMHGYCWPSEKRLADDCGTSHRTVQRVKARLVKKKLLKSVRRKSKTTGDPISNLSRINLPLLASMARKRDQYDDDLIGAITFDDDTQGDPETTLKGTPDAPEGPSDLLTRHDGGYPTTGWRVPHDRMAGTPRQDGGQSVSDPVVDPEGNLSLSSVVGKAEVARAKVTAERETLAAPNNHNHHQAQQPASIPSPRSQQPQTPALAPQPTQPAAGPQTAPVSAPRPTQAAQPAPAPQTAATALDSATRVVRAAGLVSTAEEAGFIAWATAQHKPRGGGWWRTVAERGDLPGLVADWQATRKPALASAAEQPAWWECVDCRRPAKGTPPADSVCADCHAAAEREAAELAARLAGTPTGPQEPTCPGHQDKPCGRPVASVSVGLCRRCLTAAEAHQLAAARQ